MVWVFGVSFQILCYTHAFQTANTGLQLEGRHRSWCPGSLITPGLRP